MNNKILIFSSRQLCYDSSASFADSLAKEFSLMGYEVEICAFKDSAIAKEADYDINPMDTTFLLDDEITGILNNYIGKEYLAVFDFNSKFPRVILDDGTFFLDTINAPFYDYLLDNPLYHHKALRNELSNYHVITPDEHHGDYIRRYYPHVKSVIMQTIGAYEGCDPIPFEKKEKCILMAGTYKNPGGYKSGIEERKTPLAMIQNQVAEACLEDDSLTIEDGLRAVLEGYGYEDENRNDPKFASQMHDFCVVEKYLRNYYRDKLISTLLSHNMPVKVMGTNWNEFPGKNAPTLKTALPVDYQRAYEKTAAAMIMADVSPFFKSGIHDRIPMGFANRTMILTDDNPFISKQLGEADVLTRFTLGDLFDESRTKKLCDELNFYMNDKAAYEDRCERAYEIYREKYTWRKVAENLLMDVTG